MANDPLLIEGNVYPGVNAHRNSTLQQKRGEWSRFHTHYINDLEESLNQQLNTFGYEVVLEAGLQVREQDEDTGKWGRIKPKQSDLGVKPSSFFTGGTAPVMEANDVATATLDMPLYEGMGLTDDETLTQALAIRRVGKPDETVAWIEVLSPSNKEGGFHHDRHMKKRLDVIKSGQTLIEVDFLHQTPGIIPTMPTYDPINGVVDEGATPYYIAVSDGNVPNPRSVHGNTAIHGFGVNQPIPQVPLNLDGNVVSLDFQSAYDTTMARDYHWQRTDYSKYPSRIGYYSEKDQEFLTEFTQRVQFELGPGNDMSQQKPTRRKEIE